MKLFAVITNNEDNAPGISVFQNQEKAKAAYDKIIIDKDDIASEGAKYLVSINEGEEFGWSTSTPTSNDNNPFFGADVIEYVDSEEENESIKQMKHVKLYENFITDLFKKKTPVAKSEFPPLNPAMAHVEDMVDGWIKEFVVDKPVNNEDDITKLVEQFEGGALVADMKPEELDYAKKYLYTRILWLNTFPS